VSRINPRRFSSRVVALTTGGIIQQQIRSAGIPADTLGHTSRVPSLGAFLSLYRVAREFRPDIVQGWLPHGNLAALSIAKILRPTPVLVWNVRQSLYDLNYEPPTTRAIIRLCAHLSRFTDAVVYNSSVAAGHHEALGYDARKTVLVPNGFDTQRFAPNPIARLEVRRELGVDETVPLIGMVARFHAHKDHATLFAATRRLIDSGVTANLVLVGGQMDAANKALRAQLSEHRLEPFTHLLGERDDVDRIFAALDLAALSSYTEAFPNVLAEAMASGLLCVTTDVGDSRSLVGEHGRTVAPRDVEGMASAFGDLLRESAAARQTRGEAARMKIAEQLSIDAMVGKYSEMYSALQARNCRDSKSGH
jgi:glycosyltransferase involved in cell wall biosynthesis